MAEVESTLFLVLGLIALALEAWALADALYRPTAAFPAAGKLTKAAWAGILALALVLTWFFGAFSLFGIAAAVAAIVYLVDVRPAVQALRPGRGPYG